MAKRSLKWWKVRKDFLNGKGCAVCGGTKKLELHHIIPFHLRPDLELNPDNLIPLCEGEKGWNHHLAFGHLGNWEAFNPNVKVDAESWAAKIKSRSVSPPPLPK